MFAAVATIGAYAQETVKIDFDYKKMFKVNLFWMDSNQDGEAQKDELRYLEDYCNVINILNRKKAF